MDMYILFSGAGLVACGLSLNDDVILTSLLTFFQIRNAAPNGDTIRFIQIFNMLVKPPSL